MLMKILGGYWVRLVYSDGWSEDRRQSYVTYALLASSLDEADALVKNAAQREVYTEAIGIFDLAPFRQLITCPDHEDQFLDIFPCGILWSWSTSKDSLLDGRCFKGRCGAGHAIDLNYHDDITEELVRSAQMEIKNL